MNFKTQDVQHMASLKKQIIESSTNPNAWRYVYSQLYIKDILTHLRSLSSLSPIVCGTGNYITDTAIVVWSGFNNESYIIKQELRKNNITPDSLWVTPVIKSESIPDSILIKYLVMEIARIAPKDVLLFTGISSIDISVVIPALNSINSNIKIHNITDTNTTNAVLSAMACCKMS